LELESLETRTLLANSVLSSLHAVPAAQIIALAASGQNSGLNPGQIRHAYGFDQLAFNNGTVAADGSGQTIAIVTAYDDPNIAGDLHTFDQTFGLSDPALQKVNLGGATVDAGWAGETALDVEWAHVVAPKANILLVEAASDSLDNLMSAVDYARSAPGTSVVSMSWGSSEFASETGLDSHFTTPAGHGNVAFVAASGDDGAWGGTTWPSVSTNVLAVGATHLALTTQGNYRGESAWIGSGGGFSSYVNEPAYQNSVQQTGVRTTPDVAYNGDPYSGIAVYSSVADGFSPSGWMIVGGTSAGTPQWAGVIALADQGRAITGQPAIDNAPAAVYALSSSAFNDVTRGFNGYFARRGYDLVTGRGSPIVVQTVAGLAGSVAVKVVHTTFVAQTATVPQITRKVITVQSTNGLDASTAAALVQAANAPIQIATTATPNTLAAVTTASLNNNSAMTSIAQASGVSAIQVSTAGAALNAGGDATVDPRELVPADPQPGNTPDVASRDTRSSDSSDAKRAPAPGVVELPMMTNEGFKTVSDSFFVAAAEDNSLVSVALRKGPVLLAALLTGFFAYRYVTHHKKDAQKRLSKLQMEHLI
jgi:subtilase family serine protease